MDNSYHHEPRFGDMIGQYRVGKTLGVGSFGQVVLGDDMNGEQRAIKVINKSTILDIEDVQRVYRETFILTTLKNDSIIRLYELIETPQSLCLVMEYAEGGDLLAYATQHGRLDEVTARRIFSQIVEGVEYCHRKRILHRDLKLENILMDARGAIKIADFGLSNTVKVGQMLTEDAGTPVYKCPEQIQGGAVGPAADIWSMGVILYALVAGFLPFEASSRKLLNNKICHRIFAHPPYVSPECRALIDKMLTIDPEERATLHSIRNDPWYMNDMRPYAPTVSKEMREAAHKECRQMKMPLCIEVDASDTFHNNGKLPTSHGSHISGGRSANSSPISMPPLERRVSTPDRGRSPLDRRVSVHRTGAMTPTGLERRVSIPQTSPKGHHTNDTSGRRHHRSRTTWIRSTQRTSTPTHTSDRKFTLPPVGRSAANKLTLLANSPGARSAESSPINERYRQSHRRTRTFAFREPTMSQQPRFMAETASSVRNGNRCASSSSGSRFERSLRAA